jgi:hypothetical protein
LSSVATKITRPLEALDERQAFHEASLKRLLPPGNDIDGLAGGSAHKPVLQCSSPMHTIGGRQYLGLKPLSPVKAPREPRGSGGKDHFGCPDRLKIFDETTYEAFKRIPVFAICARRRQEGMVPQGVLRGKP